MADGYLEKHQEEYEARKAEWLRKKKHLPSSKAAARKTSTASRSSH